MQAYNVSFNHPGFTHTDVGSIRQGEMANCLFWLASPSSDAAHVIGAHMAQPAAPVEYHIANGSSRGKIFPSVSTGQYLKDLMHPPISCYTVYESAGEPSSCDGLITST